MRVMADNVEATSFRRLCRIYDLGILNSLFMPLAQVFGSTCWHECLLDQLDDALMVCVTMFETTIGTTSCTYV